MWLLQNITKLFDKEFHERETNRTYTLRKNTRWFWKKNPYTPHHTIQKVTTCISSLYEILILSNTYLFYHFSSGNYSSSLFTITISVWFDIIFTHVRISFRSPFFPFFFSLSLTQIVEQKAIVKFLPFPTFQLLESRGSKRGLLMPFSSSLNKTETLV